MKVTHLGTLSRRTIERHLRDLRIGQGNREPGAKQLQLVFVELLLLVRDVATLASLAEAIPLDRPGQDDGRGTGVLDGGLERRMHLHGVMTTQAKLLQLGVGEVRNQLQELRRAPPEMLANIGTRFNRVLLVLPVDRLAHTANEGAIWITGQQRIPITAPNDLDDVPASPAERRLQLLNDLPVATHRPIQTLQVAVDDEDQIVELLTRSQCDRTK